MRGISNKPEDVYLQLERSEDGHLLWTGTLNNDGYGVITIQGKRWLVHRLVYTLEVGPIAEGYELDHVVDWGCGIRHCADSAHLEPVTHRENVMRSSNFVALKARQTHCIHGHRFSKTNTMIRANGTRACRTCRSIRNRAHRELLKVA